MSSISHALGWKRVGGVVVALLTAACSVLPQSPELAVHALPIAAPDHVSSPPVTVAWSLRVATPQAGASLSSARIVVVPEPNRVSVYQGVRWSDPTPSLLRERLIEGFRRDGRVMAIGSDQVALMTDFELDGDLGAFHSEYRGDEPVVVLRFDARLVDRASLRILAAERFEVEEAVGGVQVPEVVSAFGRAADRLATEVVAWTVEQGESAASGADPLR